MTGRSKSADAHSAGRVLRGAMTALITPFDDGAVDIATLDALIDKQLEGGTDAIVVCGTTGEAPTLTSQEQQQIIEHTVKRVQGRCRVVAGTGSNGTASTIESTRRAAALGVDGALIVTPYYNRPTQEGMYLHYAAIAEAVDLPIILYNVPARTGVDLRPDTVMRLCKAIPQIVATKQATGTMAGVDAMVASGTVDVLCGDDSLMWPMMAAGAVGAITVVGNIAPELVKRLVEAAGAGNVQAARDAHARVAALADGLAVAGPNPVPIKAAMALAGLCREEWRLPLTGPGAKDRAGLQALLRQLELL